MAQRTRTYTASPDDVTVVNEAVSPDDVSVVESTPMPAAASAGMDPQSTIEGDPIPGWMSDSDWAALAPREKMRNLLTWGGNAISGMTGMGSAGRDAVEHPKTTLALAAVPLVAKAIPRTSRAGKAFQDVMAKTKDEPIDISGPGNQALRLQELAERGGSMPKVARDFIRRVTDPARPDLTYGEARDYYSNLSRLSADEFKRLTPAMRREVGAMRVALNKSLEGATARTGSLPQYQQAMREYARASQLKDVAKQAAKWGAGAIGAGAAYNMISK